MSYREECISNGPTRYGAPYQGSKNAVAEWVVSYLPPADVLVEPFAGGCAVTHAALLSGKFGRIVANDISDAPGLFLAAISGRYGDERRWISREDFAELKDSDPYVRYCWSFGNGGKNYLYSVELEPWKKALHYARVFSDVSLLRGFGIDSDGSRGDIAAHTEEYRTKYIDWYIENVWRVDRGERLALVERLRTEIRDTSEELRAYLCAALKSSGLSQAEVAKRLGNFMVRHYFAKSQWAFPTREQYDIMRGFMPGLDRPYDEIYGIFALNDSLQSLQSLQRLQRLQRLEVVKGDYRRLEIPDGAVVYCDPPYKGTKGYLYANFDHAAYYDWCEELAERATVVMSEYSMPEDRFVRIASKSKAGLFSGTGSKKCTESLFMVRGREIKTESF